MNEGPCFLCQTPCTSKCSNCRLVYFCSPEHFSFHQSDVGTTQNVCLPFASARKEGIGRILVATRTIKPLELILVDPGTVTGPNYTSIPVCLECLTPVTLDLRCPGCRFPMCSMKCIESSRRHSKRECEILRRCDEHDWPENIRLRGEREESCAYSVITPLRMLLLEESKSDGWKRTNQLMDHMEQRKQKQREDWDWYQRNVVSFLRRSLGLGDQVSEERIHRAIGVLDVNAVALQCPVQNWRRHVHHPHGKGLYPIFAIMSHYCVCNARYAVDPKTLSLHVRARRRIAPGEEISVQYLSALVGNLRRRRKIYREWHFECECRRCADPTECGSFISAVKCEVCGEGDLLPEDSLNPEALWRCCRCGHAASSAVVEAVVDATEEELDAICASGEFVRYHTFLEKYSGSLLHPNHFLLMTATRQAYYICTVLDLNSFSWEKSPAQATLKCFGTDSAPEIGY